MSEEGVLSFSASSIVEDVLQQHNNRSCDANLTLSNVEELALRRYEAAGWLRKMVGVVGGKDLPAEPSEEGFRLGLRNGIILCNVLNKVQPGTIPKVVEAPVDSGLLPDAAALSAHQYFENVRNFLNAVQEMGLSTFDASDLEKVGETARVVNCVLALKSYSDWKETGGIGSWKYLGSLKSTNFGKCSVWKNSEPFMNSLSRAASMTEKILDSLETDDNSSEMHSSGSLNTLIRAALSDRRPEEVPTLVESMLHKVMEEFKHRLASQNELVKTTTKFVDTAKGNDSMQKAVVSSEMKMEMEDEVAKDVKNEECFHVKSVEGGESEQQIIESKQHITDESKCRILKQQGLVEQQEREIQELKHILSTTKVGIQFIQRKFCEEFSVLGRHLHGLAHAASGYRRVLEENRKLYNQVQDLKGSIRVYCRVRPFLPGLPNRLSTVERLDDGSITVITPSKYGKEGRKSFNFNKVFGPSTTQAEVFSDTQPLIRSVLDGYNVCIFAYGQTGSGKTHTMSGPKELTEQSRGVNYRALGDLFHLSKQREDIISYDISVQMMEIYNEQVRDLLANDGASRKVEIRNTSQKGLSVPDATLVPVTSTSDVIELMNIGHRNRAVSATAMNDRSSRSHSCLTVHVRGRDLASGTTLRGCMHLVDLAGSERVDKSEVTGDRLKEAQHINKSLSALGDVIASLAQKNSHVPYRNSKLTQLLQDSLGGQAKTLMFVHISPESDAIGETVSTLKFAERVATVELGAARMTKETGDVRELKEQIAVLKAAITRKEGEPEYAHSPMLSPEVQRIRSGGSSPTYSYQQGSGEMPVEHNYHSQPVEDAGDIEPGDNSGLRQEEPSFDLQDFLVTNSRAWSDTSSQVDLQEGEKQITSRDWVDKVLMNQQELNKGSENPLKNHEGNSSSLPKLFYQTHIPSARTQTEKQYNKQGSKKENCELETAMAYDLDDLERQTSDSSEADAHWQSNIPRASSVDSANGFKIKKYQWKSAKSLSLRSPSSSSSWIVPNGGSRSLTRPGRPPSIDRRRSLSLGKIGSRK